MIELLNKKHENGDTTQIKFDVKVNGQDVIVTFVQAEFSDVNKWKKEQVLTDMFISRCKLLNAYCQLDPTGEKTVRYVKDTFSEDLSVIEEIHKLSKESNEIVISLPTSRHAHSRGIPTNDRMFKNTFLPLIVSINGEDVSRDFWDFDTFESNAVNVAYQALIKGEIPTSNNDLVDFYGVQKLHQQLIQDEVAPTSTEDTLSR